MSMVSASAGHSTPGSASLASPIVYDQRESSPVRDTFLSALLAFSSLSSSVCTRPSGPTAVSSAVVSPPDPAPTSRTLSPAFTSQCIRIVAASLGEMICAPLSREPTRSRTVGRNTVYSRPATDTGDPSSRPRSFDPSTAPRPLTLSIPNPTVSQYLLPSASCRNAASPSWNMGGRWAGRLKGLPPRYHPVPCPVYNPP